MVLNRKVKINYVRYLSADNLGYYYRSALRRRERLVGCRDLPGVRLGQTYTFLASSLKLKASEVPSLLCFYKNFPGSLVLYHVYSHYQYFPLMNDQTENDKIKVDQLAHVIDLNAKLLGNAASTYAYNKINNLLLMQVLAKVEGRDLEEIRNNVDKYIAQFTEEYIKKNS